MEAAVVYNKAELPVFVKDFKDPVIQNEQQVLIQVKATALKNLDKMQAKGVHYSTQDKPWTPKVVGTDGVGVLQDGTRVYGLSKTGMMAQKALVQKNSIVKIPDNLDNVTAAALGNAVMGSALALRFKGKLKKGQVVLINGATGVTGKLAVQIAKYYGASRVIVTGRNKQVLQELLSMGASDVINLQTSDESFVQQLKQLHKKHPIDVVIDYLWGSSAQLILSALKSDLEFSHPIEYVTLGGMISDTITLSSSVLRSSDIRISGCGMGSWSRQEVELLFSEILPEIFELASLGKLIIHTQTADLKDIQTAWQQSTQPGKRLVILI
ncbi:quinone oxidoreductase family protein [Myroides sp. LJL110]